MSQLPTVANLTLVAADTEYEYALGARTSRLSFQCRTGVDCRFAFVADKVAAPTAPYMTLKSGQAFNENGLETAAGDKVYFATSSGTAPVIEIMTYE